MRRRCFVRSSAGVLFWLGLVNGRVDVREAVSFPWSAKYRETHQPCRVGSLSCIAGAPPRISYVDVMLM